MSELTFASMHPLKDEVLGLPHRLQQMHRLHGAGPPWAICKHCAHLVNRATSSKAYYKCDLTTATHGPGTDWRLKWPACGTFKTKETE